jgi:demethylmacrocin O-methyltransferase
VNSAQTRPAPRRPWTTPRDRLVRAGKRAAARHVKPLVSDAVWDRLRGHTDPPRPTLTAIAKRTGTDKWGLHYYTPHYERHLAHLRDESFVLLEIGVGGYARTGEGGGSVRMWRRYFPKAQIVGLDIEDKSFLDRPRLTTVLGDQTDSEVLTSIIERFGTPRVVIDDGSHRPADIIRTFEILFPQLPDGAIYAIEDTQTSYWPEFGGSEDRESPDTTMSFVKRLLDGLNHEEFLDPTYEPTYSDTHIRAVHCYHNLVVIEKGDNREGSNKRRVLPHRFRRRAAVQN